MRVSSLANRVREPRAGGTQPASGLDWKSTVYGHGDNGYSTWTTPYTPSPNGAPLSIRTQQPAITRYGLLSSLNWVLGRHTVETGIRYEYGQFTEARYFSQVPLLGQGTLGDPFPEDGFGTNSSNTPWSANEAGFRQIQNTLKPETDWVYEGGYRLTTRLLVALLSVYHVDFSNRLQTISFGPVISPITAVQNVGGVTTNGVELSGTLYPLRHLSIYNSISYNRSTFDDDLSTSSGVSNLRGKSVPNYPSLMYKGSIAYQIGRLNAHIDGNSYAHRYLSYLNDASVPGYFIANLGARYVLADRGPLSRVDVQFNAYNLFNTRYVATTGENGNPISGDYQTFLMGAPRQFFGSVGVSF
ncbi:TonB-dependent receptor [Acetobacteraceae bacterium KSS8]|uniref:TonB-dependent receptor n=1 Tax=Endosaccharibacter trunci TaxID=2812733 RepID=A0ABT1W3Z0_9PROT|nr:TonB-dependent receptor [Acetobacteraceae bacterium KSS8]